MVARETTLQPITTSGWRMGLGNMLAMEMGRWFKTKAWVSHAIIWGLIVNGMTGMIIYQTLSKPGVLASSELRYTATLLFFLFLGMAPSVGAVISMQDAVVGEKQSGTAAWVLSKPISRLAFIVSKLIADGAGFFVSVAVVQGIIGYLILSLTPGGPIPVLGFAAAMLLAFLNILFYLALTLMLGTFFPSRGGVIGIPLLLLFGYQFIAGLLPVLWSVMPWHLTIPLQGTGNASSLAGSLTLGQPLSTVTPILSSAVMVVVFVCIAVWRFRREEF